MEGFCDQCEEHKAEVHRNRRTGLTTCRACYQANREEVCTRCNAVGRIVFNDGREKICPRCYRLDSSLSHEKCCGCGRVRQVHIRKNDKPYCQECARADVESHEQCVDCGRTRRVYARMEHGPICGTCNRRRIVGLPKTSLSPIVSCP
jgi:hypothetical protein